VDFLILTKRLLPKRRLPNCRLTNGRGTNSLPGANLLNLQLQRQRYGSLESFKSRKQSFLF
jgi:hypothetical protein